jgi:hypothetical protein
MAFIDDLITVMTSDVSLNTWTTGGIVYENLPVDFDFKKDWIVFGYSSAGYVDTLGQTSVISYYDLEVQVISPLVTNVIRSSNELISLLRNYNANGICFSGLISDGIDINAEKDIYYNTLSFNVTYRK